MRKEADGSLPYLIPPLLSWLTGLGTCMHRHLRDSNMVDI
jgi:hypothetical protein